MVVAFRRAGLCTKTAHGPARPRFASDATSRSERAESPVEARKVPSADVCRCRSVRTPQSGLEPVVGGFRWAERRGCGSGAVRDAGGTPRDARSGASAIAPGGVPIAGLSSR